MISPKCSVAPCHHLSNCLRQRELVRKNNDDSIWLLKPDVNSNRARERESDYAVASSLSQRLDYNQVTLLLNLIDINIVGEVEPEVLWPYQPKYENWVTLAKLFDQVERLLPHLRLVSCSNIYVIPLIFANNAHYRFVDLYVN